MRAVTGRLDGGARWRLAVAQETRRQNSPKKGESKCSNQKTMILRCARRSSPRLAPGGPHSGRKWPAALEGRLRGPWQHPRRAIPAVPRGVADPLQRACDRLAGKYFHKFQRSNIAGFTSLHLAAVAPEQGTRLKPADDGSGIRPAFFIRKRRMYADRNGITGGGNRLRKKEQIR